MRPSGGLGRECAKLFAARTVSNLGDGMTLVAGPLLAATLTRDPLQIAGLALAQRLPWLLFALLSSALVDRLDRRRLMAAADVFRSAAVGGLGFAVLFDLASLPLLYGLFLFVGTAETLFSTASASVLPAVVAGRTCGRRTGASTRSRSSRTTWRDRRLGACASPPSQPCPSCSTPRLSPRQRRWS